MIIPSTKLLKWSAVLIPAAVLGALVQEATALALGLYGLLAFLAGIDAVISVPRVNDFDVELPDVIRFAAGRRGAISIAFINAGRYPAQLRVSPETAEELVADQDELHVSISANAQRSIASWSCVPAKRGKYIISRCWMAMMSLLGFWEVRFSRSCSCEVRVYPNLDSERKKLAMLFMNRQYAGVKPVRMLGKGREFERLREYMHGDSFQDIDWKATARRRKPITRLYQVEKTQEIYVLIDHSRLSALKSENGIPVLEQSLKSALVLGHAAHRQGDAFGLLTFSNGVSRFVRASTGKAHFASCYEALYTLMPQRVSPDYNEMFAFVRTRLRKRALLVCLADFSDSVVAESFMKNIDLIGRRHLVMAVMARPPEIQRMFAGAEVKSEDEIYLRLAGHAEWERLSEFGRRLWQKGVGFSMVEASGLSGQMVNEYMRIKARQMI